MDFYTAIALPLLHHHFQLINGRFSTIIWIDHFLKEAKALLINEKVFATTKEKVRVSFLFKQGDGNS
jgi:hypothetical protein